MDDLRLILLLFGAGLILAVYTWTRLQNRPRKAAGSPDVVTRYRETDEPDEEAIMEELVRMEQVMSGRDPESTVTDSERLLIISVVAPQGGVFSGDALLKALQNNKLQFDDKGIYQRVTVVGGGGQQAVFGIANLVKPGTFSATDMRGFSTPGITLFLQLPGPLDPVEAFDDFVHTAERLAVEMGGELQDQKQCVITHQSLMQIREGIVEDQFLRRAAS